MTRTNRRQVDKNGIPLVGRTGVEDVLNRIKLATPNPAQRATDAAFYHHVRTTLEKVFSDPEIMGWLASQRAASPARGVLDLNRVLDHIASGEPIPLTGEGSIGVSAQTIKQLAEGNRDLSAGARAKISDFVDAALHKQTRSWMGDHPGFGAPAVVDRWGYRSWGFVDSPWINEHPFLRGLKKDTINDHTYEFVAKKYHDLTEHMNAQHFDGRSDWTVPEAQAMDWAAVQRYYGKYPEGMPYAFDMAARTMHVPAAAGDITPLLAEHRIRQVEPPVIDAHGNRSVRVMGSPESYTALAQRLAQQHGEVWVTRNVGTGATKPHIVLHSADPEVLNALAARAKEAGFTHARWIGDHYEIYAPAGRITQKKLDGYLNEIKAAGAVGDLHRLEFQVHHG